MNNLPNHHGPGPPEARGPMQQHRLHRLKADGPGRDVFEAGGSTCKKSKLGCDTKICYFYDIFVNVCT